MDLVWRGAAFLAVPFSFFGCWFFRRLSRQSPGACGSTIAVRSRRSGLPRPHPRTPSASYGFPRAYRLPARPGGLPRQALPAATSRQQGRTVCLGFSPRILGGGGSCGARSRPAARAAFGSLRMVLRHVIFASRVGGAVLLLLLLLLLLRRMGGVRSGNPKEMAVCRT